MRKEDRTPARKENRLHLKGQGSLGSCEQGTPVRPSFIPGSLAGIQCLLWGWFRRGGRFFVDV